MGAGSGYKCCKLLRKAANMLRSMSVGFIPYVVMLIGIPFFNRSVSVGGIPLLALWMIIWVVLSPAFLALASRLLPRAEREDQL